MSDTNPPHADPATHLRLIEDVLGRDDIQVVFGPSPRTGHSDSHGLPY